VTTRADVVVVGAGAMGAATAWWLARRGHDVVLLEQFEQGHVRGSSHGASRIFRLAYPFPRYVRMAQLALPLWRELEDDSGTVLLDTTGGLDHGEPVGVQAVAEALDQQGAPYEFLPAPAAAERWPAMHFDTDVLYQPDAGRCRADDTVRALQDGVARQGGILHFDARAEAVSLVHDDVVIRTADGEYRARVCVAAAGPWIAKLLGAVVALPPLTITQEQVFHFRPCDGGGREWPSFIHHRQPYVYGLESPGQGVKVAEHHAGRVVDPDQRDFEVDPGAAARVKAYVKEWLPGLEPEPADAITCLYTTTPTEDFVVERHGPIVAVSACSGHGFKFTPLIGRLAADLATASR
jgi:sarcosine oxidase